MVKLVRQAISEQQSKLKEDSPAYTVGEHLKEIIGNDERIAEIVLTDLKVDEMDISHCEKKIKEYADNHKKGSFAFVSPKTAEGIIREFYGITAESEPQETKKIDLADFF